MRKNVAYFLFFEEVYVCEKRKKIFQKKCNQSKLIIYFKLNDLLFRHLSLNYTKIHMEKITISENDNENSTK